MAPYPVTSSSSAAVYTAVRDHLDAMRNAEMSVETVMHRQEVLAMVDGWLLAHAGCDLLTATEHAVQKWMTALRTEPNPRTERVRSAATRRAYLSHLRMFCRWARKARLIDVDPTVEIPVPKVPPSKPRCFPDSAVPIAIRCAPEPIKTWLVLGLTLGARRGEVTRIERGDVFDLDTPPVLELRGKGGKRRTVPLSPEALLVLAPWLRGARGALFRNPRTRLPYTPKRCGELVSEHLHGLGIEATMHWTRHAAATRAILGGHRVTAVQQLLGHASLASTMIYVHETDQAVQAIVDALGLDMARVLGRPDLRVVRDEAGTS